MSRRVGSAGFWLLMALAASAGGCRRFHSAVVGPVPNLELPEPTPPHPALPPEVATMVYPEVEKATRDPFLTVLEQAIAEGTALPPVVKKEVKEVIEAPKIRKLGPPPIVQRIIRQLHEQVKGIILGAPNIFIFKNRTYQEGDVIDGTDWVVVSVQESGIRLRSRDGSGSDYLPFTTSPSVVFEFKGGSDDDASDKQAKNDKTTEDKNGEHGKDKKPQ